MATSELIMRSDEELAVQAQQGCAASFDALLRRFQTRLLQFLRRRARPADAEDLLQETFVRAYRSLDQYRSRWRFATWLFAIARRVTLNYYRRTRPVPDGEAIGRAAARCAGPAQAAAAEDGRRYLWETAAGVLTEDELTALWLHYVEDLPARDVGRVLGRSWVSVKTMMFRARKKLLPVLAELGPDDRGRVERGRPATACPGVEVRDDHG
jgi:RNA polymerase sigma-70 factor (ECF subfamily)